MAEREEKPRIFLKDSDGEYYVLTPEMREPAKVPAAHKHEVDAVLNGQEDVTGFAGFAISAPLSFGVTLPTNLTLLGACNGHCGMRFGVIGTTQQ